MVDADTRKLLLTALAQAHADHLAAEASCVALKVSWDAFVVNMGLWMLSLHNDNVAIQAKLTTLHNDLRDIYGTGLKAL